MNYVQVNQKITVGNGSLTIFAGPCSLESEAIVMQTAEKMVQITQELGLPYVFKSSFDKANRSSINSWRGPGIKEGLKLLKKVKAEFDVPLLTDIHSPEQASEAAEVCDVLQIPAFLCRQTDLIIAAAKTGRVIKVKKGQFLAPWDMKNVIQKCEEVGNKKILLTERGTSFGYNTLVVDMTALPIMRKLGYPVVIDATHCVQQPGGLGQITGGKREMIPYLMRAAVATGVDGIFLETHPEPNKGLSDAATMLPLNEVKSLLKTALEIHKIASTLF